MLKATKHKNGTITLDGKICPFRAPVLLPSQLGGIDIQHISCDSTCTHFHHINEDGKSTIIVTCGTGVNLPVNLSNKSELL